LSSWKKLVRINSYQKEAFIEEFQLFNVIHHRSDW